jgi:hypothetical protein
MIPSPTRPHKNVLEKYHRCIVPLLHELLGMLFLLGFLSTAKQPQKVSPQNEAE